MKKLIVCFGYPFLEIYQKRLKRDSLNQQQQYRQLLCLFVSCLIVYFIQLFSHKNLLIKLQKTLAKKHKVIYLILIIQLKLSGNTKHAVLEHNNSNEKLSEIPK